MFSVFVRWTDTIMFYWLNLLAQIVQHHDVGIHVEEVISVGRVVVCGPFLRLWAFVRKHVVAVLGLIVHTVEPCHLQDHRHTVTWLLSAQQCLSPQPLNVKPHVWMKIQKCCCSRMKLRTYFRKTWTVLCFWGLTVASKSGRKTFSSILAKFGISFFDLKMSLKDKGN